MVFVWATVPTHTLHEIFSDHQDNEHGSCSVLSGLTTVESKHQHCDILDYIASAFEGSQTYVVQVSEKLLFAEFNSSYISTDLNSFHCSILSRGPPVLI